LPYSNQARKPNFLLALSKLPELLALSLPRKARAGLHKGIFPTLPTLIDSDA
jgi:hypothetical protein